VQVQGDGLGVDSRFGHEQDRALEYGRLLDELLNSADRRGPANQLYGARWHRRQKPSRLTVSWHDWVVMVWYSFAPSLTSRRRVSEDEVEYRYEPYMTIYDSSDTSCQR